MNGYSDYEKRMYAELRDLRNTYGQVIDFIKKQQWYCLQYSLLLQGGLLSLYKLYELSNPLVFIGLSLIISISSIVFLTSYQRDLLKNRCKVEEHIDPYLTLGALGCLDIRDKRRGIHNFIKEEYHKGFIWFFILAIVITHIIVLFCLTYYYDFPDIIITFMVNWNKFVVYMFDIWFLLLVAFGLSSYMIWKQDYKHKNKR